MNEAASTEARSYPSLYGRVAVVTGALGGLGRGITNTLASNAATVVLGHNGQGAEASALVEELAERGRRAVAVEFDITDGHQVAMAFERVHSELGGVDVLVNCAGINRPEPFTELSEAAWDEVIDTNLKGAFLCSQQAVRQMVTREHGGHGERGEHGGAIITVTSESGMSSAACPIGNAHYAASKLGLAGLTRVIAANYAPHVRANAVAPGWVDTPIHDNEDHARRERVLAHIPMGRRAEVADVAETVVFLASDAAAYITGQTIVVGGGRVMI